MQRSVVNLAPMQRPLLVALAVLLHGGSFLHAAVGTTKEYTWREDASRVLEERQQEIRSVRRAQLRSARRGEGSAKTCRSMVTSGVGVSPAKGE